MILAVSGSESVLINFSKISIDILRYLISTEWQRFGTGAKQSGNIDIEIKTYSGGTMIQSGLI
jgi:hypothetical protein